MLELWLQISNKGHSGSEATMFFGLGLVKRLILVPDTFIIAIVVIIISNNNNVYT